MGEQVKILGCDFVSPFQDKQHGKGQRVHNQTKQHRPAPERQWRCTGCGKEKS